MFIKGVIKSMGIIIFNVLGLVMVSAEVLAIYKSFKAYKKTNNVSFIVVVMLFIVATLSTLIGFGFIDYAWITS